ncbi:peroxiredoxin [Phenylobacterium sp.]|uniref:peroxiredoxin n=1 Tax=Phenylobacterium sp. TaxID=1871053 RepID=UPI00391B57F8
MDQSPPTPAPALRPGAVAPAFRARTTLGERALADYRGRWLVFFSHPADFTPVCTSEFVTLSRRAPEFAALNCDLLGLSVDSLFAHLAWVVSIEEHFGVRVPFPIVEDPSMAIATAYGMTGPGAPDASTVRATFFIDPAGIVRAMTWYPMTNGRSVDEMLRLLAALQETDRSGASTPEGWTPGQPPVAPAPVNLEEVRGRTGTGPWYLQELRP